MYEVLLYEDTRGNSPVHSLLSELHVLLKKVFFYIERLEQQGTWIGEPYAKFIEDSLWELRPGNLRIFFFGVKSQYILLHAFYKTTNKTPRHEIERNKGS